MTDSEWAACVDPQLMLEALRDRASDRKLRLFACACCRTAWEYLADSRGRRAVEVAERFADGLANPEELTAAAAAVARAEAEAEADRAMRAMNYGDYLWYAHHLAKQYAARAAAAVAGTAWEAAASAAENSVLLGYTRSTSALEAGWWGLDDPHARAEREAAVAAARETVCGLLRDIFGDPPGNDPLGSLPTPPDGGLVADLARTMYDERTFDRMPALGDALEESGCVDAAVLSHCRDRGGHVRGCWVIDALLRKS